MLIPFIVVYFLSHQHNPEHWAVDVWTWIVHHVVLTVLILIFGA